MKYLLAIQSIDRRIMYLLLIVVIAIPMFVHFEMPTVVNPEVRGIYDTVESIPQGKIAILTGDWGAGTIAESQPQSAALMRHLFRRNIPFAILPFAPQTSVLMEKLAESIARTEGKRYGDDWVNWGWRVVPLPLFFKGLGKDLPATVKQDYKGVPIGKFKAMQGVKTIHDVGFIAHITPVGGISDLIAFAHEAYGIPLGYAPTAVMVAQGYDPLDANQIVGMLPGMVGAAQYEKLLGQPGNGLRWSNSLSFAELLMIFLVALANIGYFLSRGSGGASP